MQSDPSVIPTEARDFLRQDHLLVRVRAFAVDGSPAVTVTLLNGLGQPLLTLPQLERVDGAAQFELPFARYARGDYRLLVTAGSGAQTVRTLVNIRIVG
jgi:hypothetical protein